MTDNTPFELIDMLVGRIFVIDDITLGTDKQGFVLRYRGKLRSEDSAAAYDQIASALTPYHLTPLFRWEDDGRQAIILEETLPAPKESNARINLLLFILTLASVLFVGGLNNWPEGLGFEDPIVVITTIIQRGWPFAVSLLLILGAHEFGHYLVGRANGVQVTLPYFIPMPLSMLGTLGAFINMKGRPKNRRVLLDLAAAGPLAGLAVTLPVLALGLIMSTSGPLNYSANGSVLEGNSIIYMAAKTLRFGELLPTPPAGFPLPEANFWLRYFFTGAPLPIGGIDVQLSDVALAGWVGLLVTAMNLIPAGQLDGGHIFYVLFGEKRAAKLRQGIIFLLIVFGFFWNGWFLWAAMIFFLGRGHAEPLDQITPIDRPRKVLAVAMLVIFVLTFTPIPLQTIPGLR